LDFDRIAPARGTAADNPMDRRGVRHLLDGMKLKNVKVEETEQGDHYHPLAKSVRLTAEHFYGRSLTAIVVAAHEVGHATSASQEHLRHRDPLTIH
jgi:Zn-dependent membrane protease YugP